MDQNFKDNLHKKMENIVCLLHTSNVYMLVF